MPVVPIPLSSPAYKNVDGTELSDLAHVLVDGYIDDQGYTRRRPGLSSFYDYALGVNNTITGMYWWPHQTCALVVVGGRVYKLTYPSQVTTSTRLSNGLNMDIKNPTIFATDGTYVFMASGSRIRYTNGTADVAYITDADCPTSVSHVAYLDTYILANSLNTNQWFWSDVGDSLSWNALNFASAAGDADHINALLVVDRQIFLFGINSFEIWENDGTTPFTRIPGGYFPIGCIAPYSVAERDGALYWLDNKRHVMKYYNGNVAPVSGAWDKEIANYKLVSDCNSFFVEADGITFLVMNFPAENKTLALDIKQQSWSEWGYWNAGTMSHQRWLGNAYCYSPDWGKHLVGARHNSYIYEMSSDYHDDNTEEIRLLYRSGHIDHGTLKRKRSNNVRFRVKRGHSGTTVTPELMLRFKDDGANRWSNEYRVNLGDSGNTEHVVTVPARGIYRTRQYELSVTDPVPVMFGRAESDVDIMVS